MSSDGDPRTEPLDALLATALDSVLGPVRISSLRRMTGGASRETWSFDATDSFDHVHELVLRRDPTSRPGEPGAMRREARTIQAAALAGLPVPEVLLDSEDSASWGSAGMIMRRVAGETLARRILREDRYAAVREELAGECGSALAALHRIDPSTVPDLVDSDPLQLLRTLLDTLGEPVPTFEYALRWLEQNRPPGAGRSIVHGDFRLGNLIVDETGLRAVLDWELVHVGDPIEDLGWLCVKAWRFGVEPAVGGFGTREQLITAYEAAGGARVDPEVLRWWEVQSTLRWGAICLTQTAVHLRGDLRSVELAAIGRRVCETEWDLLLLLAPDHALAALARAGDAADAPTGTDTLVAADGASAEAGLHGRPSSLDLVVAVREFLSDHVMVETEGALSFHARVAANVLGMVERELASAPARGTVRAEQLGRLGVSSERELTEAVRDGRFAANGDELLPVLADGVVARVEVANPRYTSIPG